MVKGTIGQYHVAATHYGSENTDYLQVYLAAYNDESLNKYFVEFPNLFETNSYLIEHEKSYGLLNQQGGEIEFTKYFTVMNTGDQDNDGKDDLDEFTFLEKQYQQQYQEKPAYLYDNETGFTQWQDQGFEISLSITRDHGRIYLTLRKPIVK